MTTLIKLAGTVEDSAKTLRGREVFEAVAGEWDTFIRELEDVSKIVEGLNEFYEWLKTHNAGMSSFSGSVSQLTANLNKIREYLEEEEDDAPQQIQKVREILRDRVFPKVKERIENYKEFANKEWKKYIEADSYPSADLYAPYKDHPEHGEIVGEYTRCLKSYREFTLLFYPKDEDQRTQFENLRTGLEELQGKLPEPPSELIQQFVEAASDQYKGVSLKTYDQNVDEIRQWLKDNNLTSKYVILKKGS